MQPPFPVSAPANFESTDQIVERLNLKPHPEGGHYRELFRSACTVSRTLSSAVQERAGMTAIYYLLAKGEISRWHVVASDEVWHFYRGEPLELLTFNKGTQQLAKTILGPNSSHDAVAVVPAGIWQAARPLGRFALCGCTVAPGFEFEDFEFAADSPNSEQIFEGPLSQYQELA